MVPINCDNLWSSAFCSNFRPNVDRRYFSAVLWVFVICVHADFLNMVWINYDQLWSSAYCSNFRPNVDRRYFSAVFRVFVICVYVHFLNMVRINYDQLRSSHCPDSFSHICSTPWDWEGEPIIAQTICNTRSVQHCTALSNTFLHCIDTKYKIWKLGFELGITCRIKRQALYWLSWGSDMVPDNEPIWYM